MSLANIVAAIKTDLLTITGIEKVEGRLVYQKDTNKHFALFTTAAGLKSGWMITRKKVETEYVDVNHAEVRHHMVMIGFTVLDDSANTEATMDLLVDRVLDYYLFEDRTLGGVANDIGAPQVPVVDWRYIHDALCHYAEIEMVVSEEVTRS